MTDTSSSLPICVYCGTPRPADETLCTNCGKPWIDTSIGSASDGSVPLASAAAAAGIADASGPVAETPRPPPIPSEDTEEFGFDDWTLPPEPKSSKAKWLIPLVLLLGFGALWVVVFGDRDTAPATTTIVASAPTTSSPVTTIDSVETTTTQVETTTSSTTATVVYPPADSWAPVGDPIPVDELLLKASGIGPIDLGTSIADGAGALVASLGSADTAGFDSTMCESVEWYWLAWGDLRGVFDGYADDAVMIAYRYESDGQGPPSPELKTLSGIRLGDTVETLQDTYGGYTVSFEVIEGKDHFRLSDGGILLLWGPVSSTEPEGIVEGIYSPDPCSAQG